MVLKAKSKGKKKSSDYDLKPFAIVLGLFGLLLTIYIGHRASLNERNLFSVNLLTLFAGLLFESFRISKNWKTVIFIFIGAYFFSLTSFLPSKNELIYNFENHIRIWQYIFIILFALFFVAFNKDKVTAKLNEGTTLVLSLSFICWTLDKGFIFYNKWFAIIILTIVTIFSIFSILNALTNIQLTKSVRLALSIWSTIMMFAFAVENIIKVFSNQDIESSNFLSQGLFIGIQYFFLGISAIYIMQNYILLAAFLPNKNGNYKSDLKDNIKDHLDRFSDKQLFIGNTLFCIIYSVLLYGLNYKFDILPRNTMIWLFILTCPMFLNLIEILYNKNSNKNIEISN